MRRSRLFFARGREPARSARTPECQAASKEGGDEGPRKCSEEAPQPNGIGVPEWELCRPTQREGASNEAYDDRAGHCKACIPGACRRSGELGGKTHEAAARPNAAVSHDSLDFRAGMPSRGADRKRRKRGVGFIRRIYMPRVLGYALGSVAVGAALVRGKQALTPAIES